MAKILYSIVAGLENQILSANNTTSTYYTRSIPCRGATKVGLLYQVTGQSTGVGGTATLQITPGWGESPRFESFSVESPAYEETLANVPAVLLLNARSAAVALANDAIKVWALYSPSAVALATPGPFTNGYVRFKISLVDTDPTNPSSFTMAIARLYSFYETDVPAVGDFSTSTAIVTGV